MLTLKRAICRSCVTQFFAYDIFLLNLKKSLSKHSDKASFVTLVFATMNWSSATETETGTFFQQIVLGVRQTNFETLSRQ